MSQQANERNKPSRVFCSLLGTQHVVPLSHRIASRISFRVVCYLLFLHFCIYICIHIRVPAFSCARVRRQRQSFPPHDIRDPFIVGEKNQASVSSLSQLLHPWRPPPQKPNLIAFITLISSHHLIDSSALAAAASPCVVCLLHMTVHGMQQHS